MSDSESPRPIIFVTGATGKIGRATANYLLESKQCKVRCLVRRANSTTKELSGQGAELVFGDMNSPNEMLKGMQGLFLAQAKAAKVDHVVLLTQWLASEKAPDLLTNQHWLMERMFEQSGLSYSIIAPGFFADNFLSFGLLRMANNIGLYGSPCTPTSKNAPPSNEDIGSCCGACLLNPQRYNGKRFRPTGPVMLSYEEMGQIIGKVVQRNIKYTQLPEILLRKNMKYQGIDPFISVALINYIHENNAGGFEVGGVTNHVKLLTGKDPENFETIVKRYSLYKENAKSTWNTVLTIAGLILPTFYMPYNPVSVTKDYPLAIKPIFAVDNPEWKRDREQISTIKEI